MGAFKRAKRQILLVANANQQPYDGHLLSDAAQWAILDPATGSIREAEMDAEGQIRIALQPHGAVLLIESAPDAGQPH